MRIKKWAVIITAFLIILSFLAWLISYKCNQRIYDLSLAILGSAIVAFIISVNEYSGEKRRAISAFYTEALKAVKVLRKAMYLWPNEENKAIILECMDSYIGISESSFGEFGNSYGDMDFIFANKSIRLKAYEDIYQKIINAHKSAALKAPYFRLAKKQGQNLTAMKELLLDLNDVWFVVEESKCKFYDNVYRQMCDEIDDNIELFRAKMHNQKPTFYEREPIMSRSKNVD